MELLSYINSLQRRMSNTLIIETISLTCEQERQQRPVTSMCSSEVFFIPGPKTYYVCFKTCDKIVSQVSQYKIECLILRQPLTEGHYIEYIISDFFVEHNTVTIDAINDKQIYNIKIITSDINIKKYT